MKSTYYKVIVILVLSVFIFGCSSKMVIRQEEIKNKHNILVVPFKAPPINIKSWGLGTFLLFGPLGTRIAEESTGNERKNIADVLNEQLIGWNPTDIVAQECAGLIQESSLLQVQNITIADIRELPGAEKLRSKEPKVFTAKLGGIATTLAGKWMNAVGQWFKKSKSTIQYKHEYPQVNADMALEAAYWYLAIEKGTKLIVQINLKLIDTFTGEKIAASASFNTIKISPVGERQDFLTFKKDFRAGINKVCSKVLEDMGIIPKS